MTYAFNIKRYVYNLKSQSDFDIVDYCMINVSNIKNGYQQVDPDYFYIDLSYCGDEYPMYTILKEKMYSIIRDENIRKIINDN